MNQDNVIKAIRKIRRKFKATWEGQGSFRIVFASKSFVYKFPLNEQGESDNKDEADKWRKVGKHGVPVWNYSVCIPIAKCRLIELEGVPVLIMEKIQTQFPPMKEPDWVSYVDRGQFGFNSKGCPVAYDFAELPHDGFLEGDEDETEEFKEKIWETFKL